MRKVWFENSAGLISIGTILLGKVGSERHNLIRCSHTDRAFEDVPNWQTRAQFEQLDARGKLSRNRHGSLHATGSQRRG
jgi:hypothetical protein